MFKVTVEIGNALTVTYQIPGRNAGEAETIAYKRAKVDFPSRGIQVRKIIEQ